MMRIGLQLLDFVFFLENGLNLITGVGTKVDNLELSRRKLMKPEVQKRQMG